jgi:hypothetical protein
MIQQVLVRKTCLAAIMFAFTLPVQAHETSRGTGSASVVTERSTERPSLVWTC